MGVVSPNGTSHTRPEGPHAASLRVVGWLHGRST